MRRLFKYLKFFRLLCTAEAVADKKNKKQPQVIRLKIDGPASILENSLKYGLQLASFFPALCRLKKWKISSAIKVRERNLKLKLDENTFPSLRLPRIHSLKSLKIKFVGQLGLIRDFGCNVWLYGAILDANSTASHKHTCSTLKLQPCRVLATISRGPMSWLRTKCTGS